MRSLLLRAAQVAIDLAALSGALWVAFQLRFDWELPAEHLARLLVVWPYAVALEYACLAALEVPRFSWRHVGLREVQRIAAALAAATAVLTAIRLAAPLLLDLDPRARYALLPLGVIGVNAVLALGGVAGVRVLRRILGERTETRLHPRGRAPGRPTVLLGADAAAVTAARDLAARPDLRLDVVGFLHDDPQRIGELLHGKPVLGTVDELPEVVRRHGVQEAIIALHSAPGHAIRRLARACEAAGLRAKIVPGIDEVVTGGVDVPLVRSVAIEDLLGREPVVLDQAAIGEAVRGRTVLVTGAGGSIGAELCRQLLRFGPARLVLVERAENALYEVHRQLLRRAQGVEVVPRLADAGDPRRVEAILEEALPDVLFHAAAHKHVPMSEENPGEAVKNNVLGTRRLIDLAVARGVKRFVLISTDKAVNPTSVMGATKRAAELYVQALARGCPTRLVVVRFGNVLGSTGSVVPLFEEQIARGGPVTITHEDVRRYFMTIPEACQLVLQAAAMGQGGELYVLDMGKPMKIVDLATDMIRLSGLRPEVDVKLEVVGLRPGEKLYEELSREDERLGPTSHPKIFVGQPPAPDRARVEAWLDGLEPFVEAAAPDEVRARLCELLPEYRPGPARPAPVPDGAAVP